MPHDDTLTFFSLWMDKALHHRLKRASCELTARADRHVPMREIIHTALVAHLDALEGEDFRG